MKVVKQSMEITLAEMEKLNRETLRGFLLQAEQLSKALDSERYTEAKEILAEMTADIKFMMDYRGEE